MAAGGEADDEGGRDATADDTGVRARAHAPSRPRACWFSRRLLAVHRLRRRLRSVCGRGGRAHLDALVYEPVERVDMRLHQRLQRLRDLLVEVHAAETAAPPQPASPKDATGVCVVIHDTDTGWLPCLARPRGCTPLYRADELNLLRRKGQGARPTGRLERRWSGLRIVRTHAERVHPHALRAHAERAQRDMHVMRRSARDA